MNPTPRSPDWWTLKHSVFWEGFSDLDLWFQSSCLQVNKITVQKITYPEKLRLMECKEVSAFRPSPRYVRPWPVILLHLFGSQQTRLAKISYNAKLRLMDCKELSLLRSLPRFLRPESVIKGNLFASQKIHLSKVTYSKKVRLIDCMEGSLGRLSPRYFRPWSVIL